MKLTTSRYLIKQNADIYDNKKDELLMLSGVNVSNDNEAIDLRIILDDLVIPDNKNDPDNHNIHCIFSLMEITIEPINKFIYQLCADIFENYIYMFEIEHPEDLRLRIVLDETKDYCNGLITEDELIKGSDLATEAYEMYHKKYNFKLNHKVIYYLDETMAFAAGQLAYAELSNLVFELDIAIKRFAEKKIRSIKDNYKKELYKKDQNLRDNVRNNFEPGSVGYNWLPGITTSDPRFNHRWEQIEKVFVKDELNLYYINLRKIIRTHLLY